MGLKNFKIWGVFLVAIVVIAFMLFQQSNSNKKELEGQAIRNMELVKGNFQVAFDSNIDKVYSDYRKDTIVTDKTKRKITKYGIGNVKEGIKVDTLFFSERNGEIRPCQKLDCVNINVLISYNDLFNSINQHKFFDAIFLMDLDGKVLYPQSADGISLPGIDSINLKKEKIPVIRHLLKYNDEEYIFYYTPVTIGDKNMILSGGIKKNKYDSIGKRVNFSYLTVLVFILCMMLFSIPLLTVFGLDKGDVLTKFRVFSIGLSFIGIMVLMGFGFAFFKEHHPIQYDRHKKNIDDIKNEYIQLVNKKVDLLKSFDCLENNTLDSIKLSVELTDLKNNTKYNELVSILSDGNVNYMVTKGKPIPKDSLTHYNLKERDYVEYFIDSEKVVLSRKDTLFLSQHYSFEAAKHELVISKVAKFNEKGVNAVTFPIELEDESSIKENINLLDKPFILFRSDGLILNKSTKISAPADNLSEILSKAKLEELMAIVRNNSKLERIDQYWNLPIFLDGFGYNATITPVFLDKFHKPIWMIYLIDENLEHVFTSLVTFETVFLLLGYLGFLALLSFHNKLLKPASKYRQWEKFSYFYLSPDKKKEVNLFVMLIIIVLYSIILFIFYLHKSYHFFDLFAIIMLITIHVKALMFIWLGPSIKSFKDKPMLYLVSLGLISIFPYYFLIEKDDYGSFLFLLISLPLIICILISYFRKEHLDFFKSTGLPIDKKSKDFFSISFQHFYLMFFISWIFLIGFFPGYILFEKVYDYEVKFWQPDKPDKSDKIDGSRKVPDEFWERYDEWRRLFFVRMTSSTYNSIVSGFIAPDRLTIEPNDESTKMVDAGKLEKRHFLIILSNLLAIFLFIVFVVWVIKNLIDRIYFLNSDLKVFDKSHDGLEYISNLRLFWDTNDLDKNIEWVMKKLEIDQKEIELIDASDFLELEKNLNKEKKVWMINNFHFNFTKEVKKNLKKLFDSAGSNISIIISPDFDNKDSKYEVKIDEIKNVLNNNFSRYSIEFQKTDLRVVLFNNDYHANREWIKKKCILNDDDIQTIDYFQHPELDVKIGQNKKALMIHNIQCNFTKEVRGKLQELIKSAGKSISIIINPNFNGKDSKDDPKLKEIKKVLSKEFNEFKFEFLNPELQVFLFSNDFNANIEWIREKYTLNEEDIEVIDCLLFREFDVKIEAKKKALMIHNFHCNFNIENLLKKLPIVMNYCDREIPIVICSGLSWKELNNSLNDSKIQIAFSQIFSEFKFYYIQVEEPFWFPDKFEDEFQLISHQRRNKAFYSNLWQELSFQEKKTCYYYAFEGFFNYAAIDVITELIQKGILIIPKGRSSPLLISETFRSFILHNISKEEVRMFRQDESKNGNVGSIQVSLLSFIFLSVAMISYFDKNFLDQATTFVTGIVGALGSIYSLFSKGIAGLRGKSET